MILASLTTRAYTILIGLEPGLEARPSGRRIQTPIPAATTPQPALFKMFLNTWVTSTNGILMQQSRQPRAIARHAFSPALAFRLRMRWKPIYSWAAPGLTPPAAAPAASMAGENACLAIA